MGILGKFPDHLWAYLFGLTRPAQLTLPARAILRSRGGAQKERAKTMSSIGSLGTAVPLKETPERSALLQWMIFTGLSIFAAVLLTHYGLVRLMLSSDRTYISSFIIVLYVITCGHCFWRTRAIAREAERATRCRTLLSGTDGARALEGDGRALPDGLVGDHIRSLVIKARAQGRGRIDQALLLRSLADRLRGSNAFGSFVSDTLMKLGLLGTIIGFIIMLAPIAGLDAADKVAMKSSMGLMSDGMAVAMYTTLAGLVGSILVRIQYYMLDAATQRVFSDAVMLTETRVTPALERRHDG